MNTIVSGSYINRAVVRLLHGADDNGSEVTRLSFNDLYPQYNPCVKDFWQPEESAFASMHRTLANLRSVRCIPKQPVLVIYDDPAPVCNCCCSCGCDDEDDEDL